MAYQIIASASRNFMSSNIQKFRNLNFGQNWEVHYFRLDFWVAPPHQKKAPFDGMLRHVHQMFGTFEPNEPRN